MALPVQAMLALLLLPLLAGCVLVVSPPLNWFQGDQLLQESTIRGEGDAKILLLSIDGFISGRPTRHAFGLVREPSTVARVAAQLRKARRDDAVKAVVLRIDSPGGTVAASDEIYHLVQRFAAETSRPVIASLGGIAASGGYYIACAADTILAQPTTITGSIGVIIASVDITGLMDKLGVKSETYTSGPNKDLLSPIEPASPEERRIISAAVDHLFQRFVHVVKQNRPQLAMAHIKTITDGRIFPADKAQQLGLVDQIGRIGDAIALARERVGVEQARIIRYSRSPSAGGTVYSAAHGGQPAAANLPMQINFLPIDLSLAAGARFMYLWEPGLGS